MLALWNEWIRTQVLWDNRPYLRLRSVKFHNMQNWIAIASGLWGMCMFFGWSQIPNPREHGKPQFNSQGDVPKPSPAAHWLAENCTKFPSRRVCCDHYPKRSVDHMSDLDSKSLSPECGMSNFTLTDVIPRVLEVTAWSFPLLQTVGKYVMIWLGLKKACWSPPPWSVISTGDQPDAFASPGFSTS